ncbi:hypothetical protein BC962_1764 [Gillisia mitskevichiae]|uniref:Lipocalin-like protein n=1 Tax=Gillisia mitskevichiae TaxID=270921 RepID=A0A495PVE2_9FLAO|nr:hypothetical protein [Gillisia mitskevichiae]RKS53512.1 hypothetical protein BC962_1764 [Gillisia mitskevichiae]
MNNFKFSLLVVLLLFVFSSCSKDDDNKLYKTYTSEDLKLIHMDSSKIWKLEAYYNAYPDFLHSQNDCYIDETYIFKTDGIVEVIAGTENCYYGDSEISASEYTFYEERGSVYLSMVKRKVSGDMVSNLVFSLPLMELEADRMLFAAGEKGGYGRSLVFVSE